MRTSRLLRKTGSLLLAASLLGTSIAPAQAAMVGTAQVIAAEQGSLDRARLVSLLEREDLQRQLTAMGVDVRQARERIASLTDAEVAQLNVRIGELPAGGATALGVFVLLLIVLVITDAMGVTDVFSFVHPAK
ncbi:MAG: DUF6627 family protein [Thiobacillus sp.]|jgi:hypothetical protein|uniref:DUF6627 family protein n=1 Tax=Thiobacillus sp. TaxID=924 RepID=UPI002895BCC2|nr:DUF6627 family protein [Thiobacillus sp.]MDT3705607.1 DUF6627 family protein [Thiobacillus sp.]